MRGDPQPDELPEGQDFENATTIIVWTKNPQGEWCYVHAEQPGPVHFPMFQREDQESLGSKVFRVGLEAWLRRVIRRAEARREGQPPRWYVDVWQPDETGMHVSIYDERLDDVAEGTVPRLLVDSLKARVKSGELRLPGPDSGP